MTPKLDTETEIKSTRHADRSLSYLSHPVGSDGSAPVGTVDLSEYTTTVMTWTTSTATPPGVREPNPLAVIEFDVDSHCVSYVCCYL